VLHVSSHRESPKQSEKIIKNPHFNLLYAAQVSNEQFAVRSFEKLKYKSYKRQDNGILAITLFFLTTSKAFAFSSALTKR